MICRRRSSPISSGTTTNRCWPAIASSIGWSGWRIREATAWNITDKFPWSMRRARSLARPGSLVPQDRPAASRRPPRLRARAGPYAGPFPSGITNRTWRRCRTCRSGRSNGGFRAAFHLTPQRFLRKLRLRIAGRALISTRGIVVRDRLELRLRRSEPLLARIPAAVRSHPSGVSRALQTALEAMA